MRRGEIMVGEEFGCILELFSRCSQVRKGIISCTFKDGKCCFIDSMLVVINVVVANNNFTISPSFTVKEVL